VQVAEVPACVNVIDISMLAIGNSQKITVHIMPQILLFLALFCFLGCLSLPSVHSAKQWPVERYFNHTHQSFLFYFYARLGYTACQHSQLSKAWLYLTYRGNCTSVNEYVLRKLTLSGTYPPPRHVPKDLADAYLLHGASDLHDWYIAEQQHGNTPAVFSAADIRSRISDYQAGKIVGRASYGEETYSLHNAFLKYPVAGRRVCVFGSQTPWVESLAFTHNASEVVLIEYRRVETDYPHLLTYTPEQFTRALLDGSFKKCDAAVSFSSFEHDGLGRYGDPLDPFGDIMAVRQVSCALAPGGIFYLGVPTNVQDSLWWNAHRVYGFARWPMLAANWELESIHMPHQEYAGHYDKFWESMSHAVDRGQNLLQPVAVLRKHSRVGC
jgi:hypothetical protein